MSGFTCEALEKKLNDLNNSQQSIQTLSLWIIHHRKNNKLIVQTWYKELKKVKPAKRLILMYLANDVIQNSRKKGPEFTKEFSLTLKSAFEFVSKDSDEKTLKSLDRIINIWNERNIYEQSFLNDLKRHIKNKHNLFLEEKKRKELVSEDSPTKKIKANITLLSQTEIELPIKGENVDSEDLFNCLKSLENTASVDAAVRERIAKLPPEVSDVSLLEKLKNKNEAESLNKKVDEACNILNEYNSRLAKELEERKKISYKLAAFFKYQKDIQAQAQKTLTEYCERLNKVIQVKNELKSHLKNLPDLTLLPSVTDGLAPLPKPGDLFTVKKSSQDTDEKISDKASENNEDYDTMIRSYVPSAVKFNKGGGIATSYNSTPYNIKN